VRRIFDFGFLIFDWWKAPGAGDAPHLRDALSRGFLVGVGGGVRHDLGG